MTAAATPPPITVRRSAWRVAYLDATLAEELADALWNRPEELVSTGEKLRAVGVRRTVELVWGPQRFVLKHYVEPSWPHSVKQLVQSSRARRTWKSAHRLADAGVATPRPVACVECRWGPLRRDSYLMYPYVPGHELAEYIAGKKDSTPDVIQEYWRQLADLWQHLARLRASLGDANLTNFIVSPTGRLWVIDLDKARFHQFAQSAAWHANLRWKQVLRNAAKHRHSQASDRSA